MRLLQLHMLVMQYRTLVNLLKCLIVTYGTIDFNSFKIQGAYEKILLIELDKYAVYNDAV